MTVKPGTIAAAEALPLEAGTPVRMLLVMLREVSANG